MHFLPSPVTRGYPHVVADNLYEFVKNASVNGEFIHIVEALFDAFRRV